MSDEPKASMNLDSELLAAYIDRRLPPEQRAAVEAQLATDPDSHAVLVETLKALEQVAEVPKVPKGPGARRWVIAAGMLAAAASVFLVIRVNSDPASSLDIARLTDAIQNERPTEARLTGGFKYAPVAPVTRGIEELASRNLALVAAAAELQQRAASNPTVENRHAWGMAQLLTGQALAAADTLSALVMEAPGSAARHSDLAAALLTRAAAGDSGQLAAALDHASMATRLDPSLSEAAYNRALALERSSLVAEAMEEWRRFLTLETDPSWRRDAELHVQQLERQLVPKPSASVPATVNDLFSARESDLDTNPTAWRDALEGSLLLAAIAAGEPAGFDRGLALSSRLEAVTGDALPRMTWADVANRTDRRAVSGGFDALGAGRKLLAANDVTRARVAFEQAERVLRAAGSPAVRWATFYVWHCAFYLGETGRAVESLEELARRSLADRQLVIGMRSLYLVGLGRLRAGQHAAVVEIERQAAELAAQVRDRQIEAVARSEVADGLARLSLADAAWRERTIVLRLAHDAGLFSVRHVALVGASRTAATDNRLFAAESFGQAALENAELWGNPAARAEARIRLADVADRRLLTDQALSLLNDAERDLASLPDSAFADGWRADLEIARGAALLGRSDGDAFAASDRAFQILSRRQTPFRIARAQWVRGKALVSSDTERARRAFAEGLRASETAAGGVDPFGRSLAEQRWLLLRELAALPVTAAQEDLGLGPIVATLLGSTSSQVINAIQDRLQPQDLVLVFLSLDRELVRWRISKALVERVNVPIQSSVLSRLISRHIELVTTPSTTEWEPVTNELGSVLFTGLSGSAPPRLTFITDAVTAGVAFATLKWPGASRALADDADLAILGSANDATVSGGVRRALVVGAPLTSFDSVLSPLPGAKDEAQQVAALYESVSLLIGADATRARFLAELPIADIVHYAGHALGDVSDPSASRLLLADSKGQSEVTGADVVQQHLRARVVVLGSCQGAATIAAGNVPIHGLARAFLQAGAQSVVASQWNVDDRFASVFLTGFHRHLAAGTSPMRAIRQQQAAFRQDPEFRHPYYWAGFNVYSRLTTPDGDPE